jgi:hypothetical protein
VPYLRQTSSLNCGPTALAMALAFLSPGFEHRVEEVGVAAGILDGQGVSTVKLATAAAKLGFAVRFSTVSLVFNPAYAALDFYRDYGDMEVWGVLGWGARS